MRLLNFTPCHSNIYQEAGQIESIFSIELDLTINQMQIIKKK